MSVIVEDITFQFYENKVAGRCRVHASDCSFCNNGKGIHPDADGENGRWSEKFNTIDEARVAAFQTGRKVVECKRCLHMNMENVRSAVA